ncbi:phosphate ABC transporter ATP-binding protein [Aquabacterium sp. A7-Y]|uniref:phosphate ABC transporter ATP-binding protein n=1 Tax=Aquabacterium sp. A7-Y TaxID=1349605 RepID=UPI00223D6173|nr:phosphate ABC transporter ATP-binding protein [Aquabacterium sp. A7-Y]MCW7540993.1 phosphate ABC transporter ATP-binding protein [Aquabacterium sp. A7-Y]
MNLLADVSAPQFRCDRRRTLFDADIRSRLSLAPELPAFTVEGLTVSYADRPVLKDVTVDIAAGHITALIGPSGCGKTTFLSCLNRMIDLVTCSAVSGRVLMQGADLYSGAVVPLMLRRHVGMVFQKPNPFPLSIRKNLEMPLRELGLHRRAELDDRIERVLTDVGLWKEVKDQLNKSALALSGGQQQRLCIARALALSPSAVLLDEPCSALDPLSSGAVEDLIVQLRGRYTVVVVTHNLAQARRIADEVGLFWVQDGCGFLIEFGTSRQVFTAPQHRLTCEYICGMRG